MIESTINIQGIDFVYKMSRVGFGFLGHVHEIVKPQIHCPLVLKINDPQGEGRKLDKYLEREINSLKKGLPCVFIVDLFAYKLETKEKINKSYLIMEKLDYNFHSVFERFFTSGFDKEAFVFVAKQLLYAVEFLQDLNIMHRDVKPDNIMFKDAYPNLDEMDIRRFNLKLIDFNTSAEGETHLTLVGTPNYQPESIKTPDKRGYKNYEEFYSVGVTLAPLLMGHLENSYISSNERNWIQCIEEKGDLYDKDVIQLLKHMIYPELRKNKTAKDYLNMDVFHTHFPLETFEALETLANQSNIFSVHFLICEELASSRYREGNYQELRKRSNKALQKQFEKEIFQGKEMAEIKSTLKNPLEEIYDTCYALFESEERKEKIYVMKHALDYVNMRMYDLILSSSFESSIEQFIIMLTQCM